MPGSPRLASCTVAPRRRHRRRRLTAGRQVPEEEGGGVRDRGHGPFEHVVGAGRRARRATHLAYVLAGGRLDFVGGGGRLEAAKDRDVPAHSPIMPRPATVTSQEDRDGW